MNKIFSNFTTGFQIPFQHAFQKSEKLIKHLKMDTFLGGLIIGAIFSLIVNMITIYITDEIAKQRALESMENEIVNNEIQAEETISLDNNLIKTDQNPNIFYTYNTYSDNVWNNPLTLQYFDQLEPNLQEKIVGYYNYLLKYNNNSVTKINSFSQSSYMQGCYTLDSLPSKQIVGSCKKKNLELLETERNIAISVYNSSLNVLKIFHPTKDRLNSWYLKLLMGNKALPILALPIRK